MNETPAGWYDDGYTPGRLRYWDGTAWTEHLAPAAAPVPSVAPGESPRERLPAPVAFDPDYRPQHAQFPRNGFPQWAWLGPVLVVASAGAAVLVLWLTGSLVWATPGPLGAQ